LRSRQTNPAVAAFQQLTRTVPIVFVGVVDPVGAGFVARLARPGGNTTGFALFEYGISGKWLALWHRVDSDRCARDNPTGTF
jgi:putative ABC transport system substrate-binding protein